MKTLNLLKETLKRYKALPIVPKGEEPEETWCMCDVMSDVCRDKGINWDDIEDIIDNTLLTLETYALEVDPSVEFTFGWRYEGLSPFTIINENGWTSTKATKNPHEWRILTLEAAIEGLENY